MGGSVRRVRKPLAGKTPSPGTAFLDALPSADWIPLKTVARALHKSTREVAAHLHERLRQGEIIASVRWPKNDVVLDVPKVIWNKVPSKDFKVRRRLNGKWVALDYELPFPLLCEHFGRTWVRVLKSDSSPLETAKVRQTPAGYTNELGDTPEIARADALRLLSDMMSSSSALVGATRASLRLFAERSLGHVIVQESRGRKRTNGSEDLLLEAFRRLAKSIPGTSLPSQKRLAEDLCKWWNAASEREPRGYDWVLKEVKRVYSALSR